MADTRVPTEISLSIKESYIGSAYSPQVDINETESGHEIEITYKAPEGLATKSFEVPDKDWQEDETARAQAESARVQAESGRVSAEDARVSAEDARAQAESSRVQAESARVAEWQTMSHDMQEATADATYVTDETNAFLQEAMGNEAQRVSAEQARIASETARESAERRRRADESTRAEAESEREINESGRVAAERTRANAETARAQTETMRAESWDTLSSNVTSATQSANQAASDARSAASTATQATTDTRQATSAADTAAANARLATANANQATSNANQATQAVTQATEQADQATTNANQAAQSATTATTNANAATESAITAASAANAAAVTASQEAEGASAAAELANAATTAATNATQAATTATTAANQATATANDAAERAEDAIEAIGDISELAVPLMSADVRGGAKLGEGLAVVDGALTISTEANESTGEVRGSIARLTAKGWAEQDGTPTPDSPVEIQVARGHTIDGKSGRYVDIEVQGKNLLSDVASDWPGKMFYIPVEPGEVLHYHRNASGTLGLIVGWVDANKENYVAQATLTNYRDFTFTNSGNYAYLRITHNGTLDYATVFKQREAIIERGDAFTGYVPYYHHTIPIPLPSKGYAAALPDGTADTLTIDGAGKWEWGNAVGTHDLGELTWAQYTYGDHLVFRSSAITKSRSGWCNALAVTSMNAPSSIEDNAISLFSTAWSANGHLLARADEFDSAAAFKAAMAGQLVFHALLTPTTESGYTETPMPSIPSQATVTCPELDDLGVSYLIGDDVRAMAEQWYARARSEYEDRLAALEQAVSEIIAG